MEKHSQFLLGIADLAVVLIVIFVGIIASLVRFRVLGKAAFIAALGFLSLGLGALFDIVYHAWAAYIYVPGSSEIFEQFYWMRTLLRGICVALGLILLIAAILVRRPDLVQGTRSPKMSS